MICRNCGFVNQAGDAFCGSCGDPLAWSATRDAAFDDTSVVPGPSDETRVTPASRVPVQGRQTAEGPALGTRPRGRIGATGPPRMAQPARNAGLYAAPGYSAIVCWNCNARNDANRTFCMDCGERLAVGSVAGGTAEVVSRPMVASTPPVVWPWVAGALGIVGVLLLGGVVLLAGGSLAVLPTATPLAVVSPSSSPIALPTSAPTVAPTPVPTAPPTMRPTPMPLPTTAPETATAPSPSPSPLGCVASTVPTEWVNLTSADRRVRVGDGETWCIHQVIVVPDPRFGLGAIRLVVGDEPLVRVEHTAAASVTEYPLAFLPAELVEPGSALEYAMRCADGDLCNAVIQIGFDRIDPPTDE